jgi:phosphate transport system protein
MFDRIWEILKNSDSLLDEAWQDCRSMLVHSRQMYELVIPALTEETNERILHKVHFMDQELNDQQRSVRKKLFQHLALSRGSDILRGLELAAIVIDIERIGDYSKNIGELTDLLRQPMVFGEFEDEFEEVHGLVTEMFELTNEAIAKRSTQTAKQAMDLYPRVSKLCDTALRHVISGKIGSGSQCEVERVHLGLVLLLRYLKRVAAHLKNVCSALVNPFHQIGYRDGLP